MNKQKTSKGPEQIKHLCGDCKLGTWVNDFNHLDWEKKPICVTCPNRPFYILRTEKGCDKWISKK